MWWVHPLHFTGLWGWLEPVVAGLGEGGCTHGAPVCAMPGVARLPSSSALETQGLVWVQLLLLRLIRAPGALNNSQHPCKQMFHVHPSTWLWAHKMAAGVTSGLEQTGCMGQDG